MAPPGRVREAGEIPSDNTRYQAVACAVSGFRIRSRAIIGKPLVTREELNIRTPSQEELAPIGDLSGWPNACAEARLQAEIGHVVRLELDSTTLQSLGKD